jgi:hypothetical protein
MENEVLKDLFCNQCHFQFNEKSVHNKHECDEKVVKNKKDTTFQAGQKP